MYLVDIIILVNYTETTKPHSSSTLTERDHHGQSSQLVELCKRFELSTGDLYKEVSDDHILKICPQPEKRGSLDSSYLQWLKWRGVATNLGLTQADIQAIESRARPDKRLMRLYVLQEWKKKNKISGAATYRVLLEALIKCDCLESANQVCELLS